MSYKRILVPVDGSEVGIPFDEVARANLVYVWSRRDFAGAHAPAGEVGR